MSNRNFFSLPTAIIVLFLTGCAMSGSSINFDGLKYPASMSNNLYGPTGNLINDGKGLKNIQNFDYKTTLCSVLYSVFTISNSEEIIELMNKKIKEAGGDGMTNVSVSSDFSMLTGFFPLNLLPMWPGCSEITIRGVIVKLESY